MIEGHGNDIHHVQGLKMDFSSNVATRKVPQDLLHYLTENLGLLSTYPEANTGTLRAEMARSLGVSDAQLLATNGSTEAFYLIANAFQFKYSLIFTPSFAEYEDACRLHQHQIRFARIQDFEQAFTETPDLVWLGNPNNPDGTVTSNALLREKLTNHPKTLFVVDEAYGDLCLKFKSALPLLSEFDNLVVIRSMTKLYTIPGLRLGYLVASKPTAQHLKKYLQPWNVNSLAQAAGLYILQNEASVRPDIQQLLKSSEKLQKQLSCLQDLEVFPSSCHFFLIRLLRGNASDLKAYLLDHSGLLIRNASNFRGLTPYHVRISAQTEAENEHLLAAIQNYLSTC